MIATHPSRARDRHGQAPAIVRPGHNCWVVARADRFRCVQDGADYFRWVRHAVLQARHSIFVIGWDIQANLDLLAGGPAPDGAPTRLDALLAFVVRRRPQLRCYVLIWDHAALYTLERDPLSRWRLGWRMPRQVRFGFDDYTPVGGSHHQKIVVVDDALAFCGGIDLTGHRWDTTAHRLEEPARTTAVGTAYGPYHEVQAMMSGPAAARLGAVARDRWRVLGDEPRPVSDASRDGLWPADAMPDLVDADVAIARTMPASARGAGSRECERLFLDSIAAARHAIYIESQYLTNDTLGAALAGRLREPDGPEVLLVVPVECQGWLERQTMGALREGVLQHLVAADRYGRLRVVYPAASRAAGIATFVHSKVMVVDDVLMRIGSANWSRRSMGVDTECDVAVDAGGNPRNPRRRSCGYATVCSASTSDCRARPWRASWDSGGRFGTWSTSVAMPTAPWCQSSWSPSRLRPQRRSRPRPIRMSRSRSPRWSSGFHRSTPAPIGERSGCGCPPSPALASSPRPGRQPGWSGFVP